MHHKLRLALLRTNARRHWLVWIILGIVTLIFGAIWLSISTASSIALKSSNLVENVGSINAVAGNIGLPSETTSARKQLTQYDTQLETLMETIKNDELPTVNGVESLFHPNQSGEYKNKQQLVKTRYSDLSSRLTVLNDEFDALYKFMNYSPSEDFAQYGVDKNQDDERITRGSQALKELSSDESLEKEIRDSIMLAQKSLQDIKSADDVNQFTDKIADAQTRTIDYFREQSDDLKSEVSNFYNTILYQ